MPEAKLTEAEINILRIVLALLTIKTRTGEVGIRHGVDRFVSAGLILKKSDRDTLDSAAKKLGLAKGVSTFEG